MGLDIKPYISEKLIWKYYGDEEKLVVYIDPTSKQLGVLNSYVTEVFQLCNSFNTISEIVDEFKNNHKDISVMSIENNIKKVIFELSKKKILLI